jgi:hypothetical protein
MVEISAIQLKLMGKNQIVISALLWEMHKKDAGPARNPIVLT